MVQCFDKIASTT